MKRDTERHAVAREPGALNRREFLGRVGLAGAGLAVGAGLLRGLDPLAGSAPKRDPAADPSPERLRYLEFAEPGGEPPGAVDPRDWRIRFDGLAGSAHELSVAELLERLPVETRRVRSGLHAVGEEPWTGFPLAALVRWMRPPPAARYLRVVSFTSPALAPNQRRATCYPWPYREGLSLEDALDPRAFVAAGIGGRALPLLRGAPLRLVLPWKRGYKSAKGIVRFELTGRQPGTFRGELQPRTCDFAGEAMPNAPLA